MLSQNNLDFQGGKITCEQLKQQKTPRSKPKFSRPTTNESNEQIIGSSELVRLVRLRAMSTREALRFIIIKISSKTGISLRAAKRLFRMLKKVSATSAGKNFERPLCQPLEEKKNSENKGAL